MTIDEILAEFPTVSSVSIEENTGAAQWFLRNADAIRQALMVANQQVDWVSSADAISLAAWHGISAVPETIRKAARRGYIKARKTSAGHNQYDAASVQAWARDARYHKNGRKNRGTQNNAGAAGV